MSERTVGTLSGMEVATGH